MPKGARRRSVIHRLRRGLSLGLVLGFSAPVAIMSHVNRADAQPPLPPSASAMLLGNDGDATPPANGDATPAAAPASTASPSGQATTIFYKNRSFRIPFHIDPIDRDRLKAVRLVYSNDNGYTWEPSTQTTPDKAAFTFRGLRDGEFWFAVQTVDLKDQVFPNQNHDIEPTLKVIIDTTPPALVLEPRDRQGNLVSVRWDAHDEYLDVATLRLEYRWSGGEWRPIPIDRPDVSGLQNWDAGTELPLQVVASVNDRAGNTRKVEILVAGVDNAAPPNVNTNTSTNTNTNPTAPALPAPVTAPSGDRSNARAFVSQSQPAPDPKTGNAGNSVFGTGSAQRNAANAAVDPFTAMTSNRTVTGDFSASNTARNIATSVNAPANPVNPTNPVNSATPPATTAAAPAGAAPQLAASPRFPLTYAVEDAGPNGPAMVELWVTRDGGRIWNRLPEDADRVSPYMVDLGGEGTFGLSLVARSATGLGDLPPQSGDAPQFWVEVDMSPPLIQLDRPEVGTGAHSGKVAITWRVNDPHLGAPAVLLSYRPADNLDGDWVRIAPPMNNTGKFLWTVPADVPDRVHIRIDAIDSLRNRSYADTTTLGPITIDRTRPRGRILGLDANVRADHPIK